MPSCKHAAAGSATAAVTAVDMSTEEAGVATLGQAVSNQQQQQPLHCISILVTDYHQAEAVVDNGAVHLKGCTC